ncbi:MAG: NAD(P)/FAD-dependent oxidoreductase [Tepidimonas sp.]|uniref:NAD(P)/FAD-dependent oxidoreductase n=1 Tax=Tepidimonas sp. TaxID=2002775 RepID=UPI004054D587
MKVAIVGSGISGLAVAHRLHGQAHITLFEANDYFGGHTHTVDVTLPNEHGQLATHGVDTGFLVFNEQTYPNLIALLAALGVPSAPSDMSFSVQVPAGVHGPALEWGGASLGTVFAQRRNLVRPRFWGMLADLLRFNRLCTRLALDGRDAQLQQPLGDFLREHGFGDAFRDWYFLPMIGCIWSCPTDQMLQFPVATMIRFCHNHGLLQVNDRPQWYTVAGGARQYVERIVAKVPDARLSTPVRRIERDVAGATVFTDAGAERFDEVVIATHSDQALALLAHPSARERAVLGAIRYQSNRAVLHTDTGVLPRRRAVWSAWNYERAGDDRRESARVCLHYWLNALQPLPFAQPVIESLNPVRPIAAEHILAEFEYHHPVFDGAAIAAQQEVPRLQGDLHTWYCGAWTGYGFHEDGLKAGLAVADALQTRLGQRRAAA